jgi:hypothetical protein
MQQARADIFQLVARVHLLHFALLGVKKMKNNL